MLVVSFGSTSYAEKSIEIFTLNSKIYPTDGVFVSGFVRVEAFYKPVILEVYDPNGDLFYRSYVNFNEEGQFNWLIQPPLGKFDSLGNYTVIARHEEIKDTSEINFTVIENNSIQKSDSVPKTKLYDSEINSKAFLNSYEFANTKPKIQDQKIVVKTSNSNQSQEGVEFFETNEFIYVLLISIAILAGIIVIWMKSTSEKSMTTK